MLRCIACNLHVMQSQTWCVLNVDMRARIGTGFCLVNGVCVGFGVCVWLEREVCMVGSWDGVRWVGWNGEGGGVC